MQSHLLTPHLAATRIDALRRRAERIRSIREIPAGVSS